MIQLIRQDGLMPREVATENRAIQEEVLSQVFQGTERLSLKKEKRSLKQILRLSNVDNYQLNPQSLGIRKAIVAGLVESFL